MEEGLYGWFTVNFLLGQFNNIKKVLTLIMNIPDSQFMIQFYFFSNMSIKWI